MYKTFRIRNWKTFIFAFSPSLLLGLLASLLIKGKTDLYNSLIRPPFAPPSFLFPIVWTVLYILMGVSFFKILKTDKPKGNQIYIYFLQLFIQFLWPILFFRMNAFSFSFIWILILIAVVTGMILFFCRLNLLAGLLQIPYLLWLLFAAYLNYYAIGSEVMKILQSFVLIS